MPSFGSGSSLYLKSCAHCIVEDIHNYGVSYWHRTHQVPGLTTCAKHQILLSRLDLNQRQKLLSSLLPEINCKSINSTSIEVQVARFTDEFIRASEAFPISANYTDAYRYQLTKKGFYYKKRQS